MFAGTVCAGSVLLVTMAEHALRRLLVTGWGGVSSLQHASGKILYVPTFIVCVQSCTSSMLMIAWLAGFLSWV